MKTTAILVTAAMIILGIYDACAVSFGTVDSSISRYLQFVIFKSPIFTFGLGAIFGHVALYLKPKWYNSELLILNLVKPLIESGIVKKRKR